MFTACLLSFSVGFLSLGLEILWVRLFSFANHSLPQAFAFVLVFYLIGIALGAQFGTKFCRTSTRLYMVCGIVLIISSVSDLLSPLLYVSTIRTNYQILAGGFFILLTAFLKAILFPIAHHLGTLQETKYVGRAISRVYVSNILGATLGPIFVGIFLLQVCTTQQSFIVVAGLSFIVGSACLVNFIQPAILVSGILVMLVAQIAGLQKDPHWLIAKATDKIVPGKLKQIVETRQGIVTIYDGGKNGDFVFGGNVYDGTTNLDPVINSNRIERVIVLSALQRNPEHVLMIGLSIGTWLKLVTSFPGVKHIDVIEINPGYLDAIKNYPPQQSALSDPRVNIYFDDGRRWLKAHPENKYDLIIMNTTYHWRVYASNLLSQEFLMLLKQHMNNNAILTYNTTNSPDAFKTADNQFKNAYLYENFVIAADFDWRKLLRDTLAKKTVLSLYLDNKPIFPKKNEYIANRYLNIPLIPFSKVENLYKNSTQITKILRPIETVTDRNLVTEYKYGQKLGMAY